MDIWNEMVSIIDSKTTTEEIKVIAKMLLNQYNTASGSVRLKSELTYFIEENKSK